MPVAAAGFLMQKEIQYLGKVISHPDRPFIAILGGAKVSDKIGVIGNLIDKVDALLVGAAMAYTFEMAQGLSTGSSLVEEDRMGLAKELLERVESRKVKLLLPLDHVVAEKAEAGARTQIVERGQIPSGWKGLDIGPQTIEAYSAQIRSAKTILWNGTLGVFEVEPFNRGTLAIARAIAGSSAISVIGGGDSVAAVTQAKVADKISHIPTGEEPPWNSWKGSSCQASRP